MKQYGQFCPLAKALDVVGDRWTLLIVRELAVRPCRYTDLRDGLPGIATNLLADRLRALEANGVVERRVAPPPVATDLFALTEAGEELGPVFGALGKWGMRFMGDGPAGGETFRSHWVAFPVARHLRDGDPDAPPAVVELRLGDDEPAVIEVGGGEVRTRPGAAPDADLVLEARPSVLLGLITGRLSLHDAKREGLVANGDRRVLDRLLPTA